MGISLKQSVKNIGATSVLAVAANTSRKALIIQPKHASQTLRVKFGSDIVEDVTEVQHIAFTNVPTAGSFKIQWNAIKTAAILFSDNASAVQTALRAVTGLSSITVAGDFTAGFDVTLTGATPNVDADLPLLVITDETLEIAAVTEVQTVTFGTVPDAGSFKLNYGGNASTAILSSANAAAVQTALRTITGLGSVTVAGDFTGGFVVTFTGTTGNIALMTVTNNSLTTSAVAVVVTVTESTAGVTQADTDTAVTETTKGLFADGQVIAAGAAQNFGGPDGCPIDAVYVKASGSNTRVEILEG